MQFRTEIEPLRHRVQISHDNRILMIGSCFTDNIGGMLLRDGFDVSVNPMGALYNPASIAAVIDRALRGEDFTHADLTLHDGCWHALQFESRRQNTNPDALLSSLNRDFSNFAARVRESDVWIVTFGTAYIYRYFPTGHIVGNCHKLPTNTFERSMLCVDDIIKMWRPMVSDRRVIFTVSPVRHLADGLHGNQLSKSILLLASDGLGEYFPAYEIVNDDLRDYRYYASDMKHPSSVAVEYIYDIFAKTYFDTQTMHRVLDARRAYMRAAHRPIITD